VARKRARLDHRVLLADPLVRSWHDESKLRSERTADVNLRQLGLCLHEISLAPAGLLELARTDPAALRSRLVEYAGRLQGRGRLNSYIAKTFVGVGSFLRHHETEFRGFPRLAVVRGESIENERVPTQEELGRLLRALPLRGQAVALLMAHAGLRPGTLAVYRSGDRALRLGDLPELDLEGLEFRKSPFLIRVPGAFSKNRKAYVTFGTPELAETIAAYLRERRVRLRFRHGNLIGPETLTKDSPLVAVRDSETETGFVTVKAVTKEIRDAMSKVVPADTTWRPYVLRSFASTQLLIAEAKGRITRDIREAILGHDLGASGRYNLAKKLHPSMIEEMRAAYARCEPFLSTVPLRQDSQRDLETRRFMLGLAGFSEAEIDKALQDGKTDTELVDMAREKLGKRSPIPTRSGQRAVALSEVGHLLEQGWEYVAPLGSDRVVVRGPHFGA